MRRNKGEGSLYTTIRKGKKYYRGQVTIGYDNEGKQIRKTVSGYDKSKVTKKMNKLAYEADLGLIVPTADKTLGEYYKYWLENVKKLEVSPNTYQKYETDYRLRVSQHNINEILITDLKSSDIQKYISWINTKNISAIYIKNSLNYLSQVLEHAKQDNLIVINPCENVKTPINKKEVEHYEPFSVDEQERIIKELDLSNSVDFAIYLAFATGLRRGELLSLTWTDVIDKSLRINKQVQRQYKYIGDKKKLEYVIKEPKTTNSYRSVPIPTEAYKKLMIYKNKKIEQSFKMGAPFIKDSLIFDNNKGDYMYINSPYRRLQTICKNLKIEPRPFHSIRHSYATRLFEARVKPKVVQKLMGHKDIVTTLNIYTHVMGDGKELAVEELNEILSI